jgi:hypothetical protein
MEVLWLALWPKLFLHLIKGKQISAPLARNVNKQQEQKHRRKITKNKTISLVDLIPNGLRKDFTKIANF